MRFLRINQFKKTLLLTICVLSVCCVSTQASDTDPEKDGRQLIDVLEEMSDTYEVAFSFETRLLKDIKVEFSIKKGEGLETSIERLLDKTDFKYRTIGSKYYVIHKNSKKGKRNAKKLEKKLRKIRKLEGEESPQLLQKSEHQMGHKGSMISNLAVLSKAQNITGTVTSSDGEPLVGATVQAKGSVTGTVTELDGTFALSVPDDATTLSISYIGFVTQEVSIDGRTNIDIIMEQDFNALAEVIVVGYGRQVKRDITGSVASISAEQIKNLPVTSFENAIHGQLPGVQVTETSGEPGAGPSIRIRGVGSISGGIEPLYVIDGFPVSKNVELGVQGDNFRRRPAFRPPTQNPLATLSPNDIESIQVLKDAAAASIYGSRGSNGVILITTKRGKRGNAPRITYDSYVGFQSVANKIDLMNSAELIEYNRDAINNAYLQRNPGASASDPNSARDNANWRAPDDFVNPDGTDTDWQDEIFNTAVQQSHNLAVSGGSDNIGYYVSGGYYNQEGIIDGTGFDRYSLRMNLETDIGSRVRLGFNLNPSYTSSDKKPAGSPYFARPAGIVYSALVHSPTVRPYNDDGTPNQRDNQSWLQTENGRGASQTTASNPLAIIEGIEDQLNQSRIFSNLYLELDITKDLTFKTFLGADLNNYKRNFFRKNTLLHRNATSGDPYGQSSSSESVSWLAEQTLSYNKTLDGGHNISAVVGYTAQREKVDVNNINANSYPDDLVVTVSGGTVFAGDAVQEEWSLASMLARVNYDFDDRFLVTASIRSDKSSRFGAGNKTGVFPSASVGYRISNDISGAEWLSDLKIRASWGKTGNFLIGNYAAIGLLSPSNYTFGGTLNTGLAPSSISNQELSWEKTSMIDIGLDFGILEERIYGSIEYFKATTSDLLFEVQVPSALGFTNAITNIGEVVNKGFELSLTSRNTVGAFKWTTNLNFSTINNEVTELGPSGDPILSNGNAGNRHITRIGDPIGSFYGYQTDGIYQTQAEIDASGLVDQIATPQPGDFRWVDVNGDGLINASDRTVTGNYMPDFTYGMTNSFGFGNLNFSFLIQGVQGSDVQNLTRRHLGNGEANFNSYALWTERWRSAADPGNGEIPRANRQTGNSNNRPSNYQVEDASYLRLRNATLAYSFPEGSIGDVFSGLRVYVTGTNLVTFTDYLGYNPEVNNISEDVTVQGEDYGAYPLSRVFTFGINASF